LKPPTRLQRFSLQKNGKTPFASPEVPSTHPYSKRQFGGCLLRVGGSSLRVGGSSLRVGRSSLMFNTPRRKWMVGRVVFLLGWRFFFVGGAILKLPGQ